VILDDENAGFRDRRGGPGQDEGRSSQKNTHETAGSGKVEPDPEIGENS
jgi:hypothetical protein